MKFESDSQSQSVWSINQSIKLGYHNIKYQTLRKEEEEEEHEKKEKGTKGPNLKFVIKMLFIYSIQLHYTFTIRKSFRNPQS